MKKIARLILILGVIIGLPILSDIISNVITMDLYNIRIINY